jgi:anti-anti-sigma factor
MFYEEYRKEAPHRLRIEARTAWDGCAEVRLEGEFDLAVAPRLRSSLQRAVACSGDVLLNLERCEFIDACALASILDAEAKIVGRGGQLHIYRPRGQVRRLLELTGVCDSPLSPPPSSPGNLRAVPVPPGGWFSRSCPNPTSPTRAGGR